MARLFILLLGLLFMAVARVFKKEEKPEKTAEAGARPPVYLKKTGNITTFPRVPPPATSLLWLHHGRRLGAKWWTWFSTNYTTRLEAEHQEVTSLLLEADLNSSLLKASSLGHKHLFPNLLSITIMPRH